ncbi:MAG: hypothetical protein WBP56_07505 [Polyangia bacterium]
MGTFAIIPDGTQLPAALFIDLEHAMDWGLRTFGTDSFSIRWIEVALLAPNEVHSRVGIA